MKDKVLKDSAWFQRTKNCRSTSSLIPMQTKILEEFENVLLNGVDGRCASHANPLLLVVDLALLVDHELLSLELIEKIITKINVIGNQSKVLSFIALKELERDGHLVEPYAYWKEKGIQNLCVVVNIGRNKFSEAYLATSGLAGNHWVCLLVEFSSTEIFYCDSLAWPASPNSPLKLKFLTLLIKLNYPGMQDFEIYVVNKDTEKNVFLYQEPNQNICGIGCLINAILITDFDIRHELRLRNKLPEQLAC